MAWPQQLSHTPPAPSFGLPWRLADSDLRRIERLEALLREQGATYQGWAVDVNGLFAVDVCRGNACDRYTGRSLLGALEAAIRGVRDAR